MTGYFAGGLQENYKVNVYRLLHTGSGDGSG